MPVDTLTVDVRAGGALVDDLRATRPSRYARVASRDLVPAITMSHVDPRPTTGDQ
jgi:hypothetical protein